MKTASPFTDRIARMAGQLESNGIDAIVLSTPIAMGYLHGFFESSHERFMGMMIRSTGEFAMICPSLSAAQAERCGVENILSWADGEDPMQKFAQVANSWSLKSGVIAVDEYMPAMFLLAMQHTLPAALFKPGGKVLSNLMRIKTAEELAALKAVAQIADEAYVEIQSKIAPGMTEIEIQAIIESAMKSRGGKPTFCIVAAGAGSAEPHHLNQDRPVGRGEMLLLDFGCELDHYQSDITRCLVFGQATDRQKEIYRIVYESHMAGRRAILPGVTGGEVDAAARKVIEDAGYGEYFIHRLGHGLGMNGHEEPNLVATNHEALEVGNCFSVEPGIYLPGELGVRVENIVTVTADGHDSFNAEPAAEILELN